MEATPRVSHFRDKSHSLPNVRHASSEANVSGDASMRRLYSLSLSQLRKASQLADYHFKPAPFNIRWLHGYNSKVGVLNLNMNGSTIAFYAASNCGILYNWTTHQMRVLQGHRHMVTCIATDAQGKWLVTADSGADNIIIIWDNNDYFPQRTLFSPHGPAKVAKVALSSDAKYLLSLAYAEKANIYFWIWSYGKEQPHATLEVDLGREAAIAMDFNPYLTEQFLILTKADIFFGTMIVSKLLLAPIVTTTQTVTPLLHKKTVIDPEQRKHPDEETETYHLKVRRVDRKNVGDFGRNNCYTFVQNTSQILVGSTRGAIYVFSYTLQYKEDVDLSDIEQLKFIKVLKVDKHKINVMKFVDGMTVTGNSAGEIHFYDTQLKLVYWVHGFTVDSVRGLSFNLSPRSYQIVDAKCRKKCPCWEKVVMEMDPVTNTMRQKLLKSKLPSDATTAGKPFLVRDFIVCTANQGVGFVDFVTEKMAIIMDYRTSHALTVTVHPEKHFVAVGYADGMVELIDYVLHKLIYRIYLRDVYKIVIPPKDDSVKCDYEVTIPQLAVTALKYSPSGTQLACGLNTGQLLFLDPATIDIKTKPPFKDTKHAIREMCFSCDSLTFACSDVGKTVLVYKYDCGEFKWYFIGKHRAHYKDITSLFFLPRKNTNGEYKLLSLGADRVMVEYDIGASSDECLELLSLDRIDQAAIPLCGIVWPSPKDLDPEKHRMNMPLILVANDEFKYKIVNYDTTMTLATILGPRYEHPVKMMRLITRVLRDKKGNKRGTEYLIFATKNIIGMQKMPLDGNPWKHVALLGHPNQIIGMCFRSDSSNLFTIGSKDSCMCQWGANYRSVETTAKNGGIDLDPYYCLIENGRPGWLFQEIRDLFYYIQILCQGTFSPAMRRVKDYIPIDSLPDLMRALGFFPSEYEVENLLVEAKYKVYQLEPSAEIDFEEFVKLYINHRPAFGENIKKIQKAFKTFAKCRREEFFMNRSDFLDVLSNYGERFSRELSWYLLSILSGQSFEDRAGMTDEDFSFLPKVIKFDDLVAGIMGVRDFDTLLAPEQQSMGGASYASAASGANSSDNSDDKTFPCF